MRLRWLILVLMLAGCAPNSAHGLEIAGQILQTVLILIALIGGAFWLIYLVSNQVQDLPNQQRAELARRADVQAKHEEYVRLADLRTVPAYPTPDEFIRDIAEQYWQRDVVINATFLPYFLLAAKTIYEKTFVPPKQLPSLEDPFLPYDLFFTATLQGLNSFTDKASSNYTEPKGFEWPRYAFFTEVYPRIETEAYEALAKPFLRNMSLAPYLPHRKQWTYLRGEEPPEAPKEDDLTHSNEPEWRKAAERRNKENMRKYEAEKKEFKKFEAKMLDLESPEGFALTRSPWYTCQNLLDRRLVKQPFTFSRDHRARHLFAVGPSGSGKTTLLSHLIRDALDKVAANEASVFVMDSQNELIPWIAKQKRFAPGGDLSGKLIYLEPSVEYPLALNIFDFSDERLAGLSTDEQQTVLAETSQMVGFFMESLVGSEASGFAKGIINYAMRALRKIPNANVEHLQQLLQKGGFERLAAKYPGLRKLSPRDIDFLTSGILDQNVSLVSMRNRLNVVMSDDRFTAMFLQKNKFDLYDALGSSKVILVNAMEGRLLDTKEAFGRFFLAKLLQATMRRSLDKGRKQECFVFVDEAQDYIAHHQGVEELQQKVRKQNVSLNFATHKLDTFDPPVVSALRQFAIQMWGHQWPHWNVTLPNSPRDERGVPIPTIINVPPFSFKDEPNMSDGEWEIIIGDMRKRFANTRDEEPTGSAPPETPPPRRRQQRFDEP